MSDTMHSKKHMASYGMGNLIGEFVEGVLVFMLFFFYEAEIGLQSWMTGLALGIYAVWDAFNDPLVGYICDRPFKFTKKWGRRFPWILVFQIPMLIAFLLIFMPPAVSAQEQPWIIFGWLVFTTCLYDTFESFTRNNHFGLFPEKFRTPKERVKASSIGVYIGFIGVVFANLIPPVIIIFGDLGSYAIMAWICVIITTITWILWLPGAKDDKECVDKFLKVWETSEKQSFFKALRDALTQKSYLAYLLFYILYQTLTTVVQGSAVYFTQYIIGGTADDMLFIMVFMLIGGICGIPIWYMLNKKTGDNRKVFILGGTLLALITLPLTLINTLTMGIINFFFWGMALACLWIMLTPTFGDVIDESVVITKKRREGFYTGFRSFMANLAKVLQAFILATVHELTGFVEGSDTQTPLAVFGLKLHFGLIPALCLLLGVLLFWKLYDITPEKSRKIKEQLKELNL